MRTKLMAGSIVLGLLAACGGGEPRAAGTRGGGAAVAVQTFQFKPSPLGVTAGTEVIWTNKDNTKHTVTSGTPRARTSAFDGPLDGPGATYSFTFDRTGSFDYFCSVHTSMTGRVTVA